LRGKKELRGLKRNLEKKVVKKLLSLKKWAWWALALTAQ
jgi:hypothetical protein